MENDDILSRRGLLKTGRRRACRALRPGRCRTGAQPAKPLDPTEVDSFLAIHADGSVTIYTSKVDVGTGLATAFRQTAAEELGIPVERFTVVEGDTALTPDHGGTGGSSGHSARRGRYPSCGGHRPSGAARPGAKQLNQPASELTIASGEVIHSGGQKVPLPSLIGGNASGSRSIPTRRCKNPATYTVVGKPILRAEVPANAPGKHPYLRISRCRACCMAGWSGRRPSARNCSPSTKPRSAPSPMCA